MKIWQFEEEFFFLSNFYQANVEIDGICYTTNEAAFQAQKCQTREEKLAFAELDPDSAKQMGRKVTLRPDWDDVKLSVMEQVNRAKYTQNPELMAMLLATGDEILEEGNTWNDTYWGIDVYTNQGENHLGRILMKLRDEFRARG